MHSGQNQDLSHLVCSDYIFGSLKVTDDDPHLLTWKTVTKL